MIKFALTLPLLVATSALLLACTTTHPTPPKSASLWQSPTHTFSSDTPKAQRIVSVALGEHYNWGQAFITREGHIAQYGYYEAERSQLADSSLAWERVVAYWRDSGVLAKLDRQLPYHQCDKTDRSINASANICRAFASDVAWSAAFISYVMKLAEVDFHGSPRHFDYIYDAWLGRGDFVTADPVTTPLSEGDMLCYLRGDKGADITTYALLNDYLSGDGRALPAHCDIVVRSTPDELWLVGGNVWHTVMLRKMPAQDSLVTFNTPTDSTCTPDTPDNCNLNHQNWVVALKLQDNL